MVYVIMILWITWNDAFIVFTSFILINRALAFTIGKGSFIWWWMFFNGVVCINWPRGLHMSGHVCEGGTK